MFLWVIIAVFFLRGIIIIIRVSFDRGKEGKKTDLKTTIGNA